MVHPLNDEEWRIARLDRLGLKEDPFKLSADPRYLYLGPEHLAVYRQAQSVIVRRRGLALITGEMGMGKSSLARRLYDVYAAEEDAIAICYIHTADFRTAMDAARQISKPFDVAPQRSFQRQMEELEQVMVRNYRQGRNVVVLLDDAQLMDKESLEVIHWLYNFDFDTKVVQILAFGQTETVSLFTTNKPVNDRIFVRLVLPPLALASALQMVMFRLRVAGRNESLINDDAFELLYESSEGTPREIIRLCALSIDALLQSDETMISSNIVREVIK